MKKILLLLVILMAVQACKNKEPEQVSGYIDGGLRILTLSNSSDLKLKVYRGDYILPRLIEGSNFTFEIADLAISKSYPLAAGEKSYIKMKKTGTYSFSAGEVSGRIKVIEYDAFNYTELSAAQAIQVISNIQPLILDVRTPGEFAQGYLKGATLLPVQVLQQRISELSPYQEQPILIYCATGNRSTVAARLLIEAGFKNIYNLRFGIRDWSRRGYEVVTQE